MVAESHVLAIKATGLGSTMGAVLAGGFISVFLSGIVCMQAFIYYRNYRNDKPRFRVIVAVIWLLDILHTIMVCATNWNYLITHFGQYAHADVITWNPASGIGVTALVTFIAHCFFIHRLYILSRNNWMVAVPLVALALLRVALAVVSTAKMIQLASYHSFFEQYQWLLSVALAIASAIDVFISVGLFHYLRKSKSGFHSMDQVVDCLMLYTLESGLLTCVTTVLSLFFWLLMPNTLVFLGFYFAISKLYANSLLATLNSRKSLQTKSQILTEKTPDASVSARFSNPSHTRGSLNPPSRPSLEDPRSPTIRIDAAPRMSDVFPTRERLTSIDLEADDDEVKRSSMYTPMTMKVAF